MADSAERYKFDLLDVCQSIHESLDSEGSCRLSVDAVREFHDWLSMRLATWTLISEPASDFDEAVRKLVQISIREAQEHLEADLASWGLSR